MPLGCSDPDCHRCRAASEGLQIAALWRARNGKDTFMGIVQLPFYDVDADPVFFKLDDPKGDLEGPGHEMSTDEFLTECMHYDNFSAGLEFTLLPLMRPNNILAPVKLVDHLALHANGGVGVVSFKSKPQDFTDSQDDEFQEKYPDAVRAGDTVKIVACGLYESDDEEEDGPNPFLERFWVDVISVTSFGMVTGVSCNDLKYCNISQETGLLAFHKSAVLGVKHGRNWGNSEEQQESVEEED